MAMTITRKTVAGTGWPLRNATDMFTALAELTAQGWTGAVELTIGGTWKLRLSGDSKPTVNATIGQWLIQDGELRAITGDVFAETYTSDEDVEFPTGGAGGDEPNTESAASEALDEVSQDSPDTAVPIVR